MGELKSFELEFLDAFKATHDLEESLGILKEEDRISVDNSLKRGRDELYEAFSQFIKEAPTHPRANKVSIINALVKALDISIADQDTAGIVRCTQELNKMTKGNLVANEEKKIITQTLIGMIDLTKAPQIEEGTIIDV